MREYKVGDRVSFTSKVSGSSELCTVRYIGEVDGSSGLWLGVEWDDSNRGKHDGSLLGKRYFNCLSSSPTAGSFVRISRPADPERSFLEAVHDKYASGLTSSSAVSSENSKAIIISGKIAQELGFDKIRKIQAQLDELRIIIVDGMQISVAQKGNENIAETCPNIVELNLSRNLFSQFKEVALICSKLLYLKKLKLSGNRFSDDGILESSSESADLSYIFPVTTELELNNLLMSWKSIVILATYFPHLTTLSASSNNLNMIPSKFRGNSLRYFTLDYNEFEYLSDLRPLSEIGSLEKLYLKGNRIFNVYRDANSGILLQFSPSLQYVDLSANSISSWGFIDELSSVFPGISGLRLSNNPLYMQDPMKSSVTEDDEGFLITIGRLGSLKALNFSRITDAERTNAELYYLSKIAKEASLVSSEGVETILSQHKRFRELCEKWGTPPIEHRKATHEDPNFLEGRLINFTFRHLDSSKIDEVEKILRREVPKTIDIYRLKGMVAKYFEIPLLKLRLIWETGEWDPVAGYDEKELESDDEGVLYQRRGDKSQIVANEVASDVSGRWMKREFEIQDSTRQLGSLFDSTEVTIRVESIP